VGIARQQIGHAVEKPNAISPPQFGFVPLIPAAPVHLFEKAPSIEVQQRDPLSLPTDSALPPNHGHSTSNFIFRPFWAFPTHFGSAASFRCKNAC
jgi:hypothetical protein